MGSPAPGQPTNFTNHGGTIGVEAGVSIVNGDLIVQQSHDLPNDWPNAVDAPIYSSAHQHEPSCLTDTRVDILHDIENWADGQDERSIFWLSGLAGTGKSTIARTVARKYYEEKKRLAASFFFSREGDEDVRCARKFVTSLAMQLMHNVEPSKQLIHEAIIKRDDIANHSLREQWHQLILGPFSKLRNSDCPTSLIIVVDALDECENQDDVCVIVQLLAEARSLTKIRLRVLLTSRPEAPIRSEFSRLQDKHQVALHQVVLHDMPQLVVDQDIDIFLRHAFERYRQEEEVDEEWPSSEEIGTLVQRASGLFIWAATAHRFICGGVDVDERLRMLLEGERHERSPEAHLDGIYITVLHASIQGDLSAQERQKYYKDLQTLLGSIVTLLSPLSVDALRNILRFQKKYVNRMLRGLHAILVIPTDNAQLLRLHHPSFRDFLLSGHRCNDDNLLVDEKAAHRNLASKCLQLMSSSLQQSVCGVDAVGTFVAESEGAQFKPCIPSELRYACHNWIQHLIRGGSELIDGGEVHSFLMKHYLHWLEALGWMGRVSEGINAISSLESMALLRELIHDMKRFVLYSRAAIEQAPLQVYCSALVFAPSGSVVKKLFADKIPGWMKKLPQIDTSWSAALQTLEGHSGPVKEVAFSPSSKVLASISNDKMVKLWDVDTGALLRTLENHTSYIITILFSPDGKVLGSASNDKSVKLWDVSTGELLHTLSVAWAREMVFSSDSKMLALMSLRGKYLKPEIIDLWDLRTFERRKRFECSPQEVKAVAFSPEGMALALISDHTTICVRNVQSGELMWSAMDHEGVKAAFSANGKVLASRFDDETIELRDATTGAALQVLKDPGSWIKDFSFSPDSTILASASYEGTLKLWKLGVDRPPVFIFKGYSGHCKGTLAFSPDSQGLAFISSKMVKLWRSKTGAALHKFEGHSDPVTILAFSPDGKVLVSGSHDGTIKLWDACVNEVVQTTKGKLGGVQSVAFSPNGKVLASTSGNPIFRDTTIKLWDASSGSELKTLKNRSGPVSVVAFSPDSKTLASVSGEGTLKEKIITFWDVSSRSERGTLESHSGPVRAVVFSPDGKILASISQNWAPGHDVIELWKMGTNEVLRKLQDHIERTWTVVFSPDSRRLASASEDSTVKLWDICTGEMRTLEGHSGVITAVAFSLNSKLLASASDNKVVTIWDVGDGKIRRTLIGHISDVSSVTPSPVSGVRPSMSYEELFRPRGDRIGNLLHTIWGDSGRSSAKDFSLDRKTRALEPGNGTVKLWDARRWHAHLGTVLRTHPADATISRLLFSDKPAFLQTHLGSISTGFSFTTSSPKLTSPPKVFISKQWIFYRGLRVLWLPPEYRATSVAVYDDAIALGRRNHGLVSLLEISDTP